MVATTFEEKSRRSACRSCGQTGLRAVLDLGRLPLADAIVAEESLPQPEPRYPLEVAFCPGCALVQILETVPPELLFGRTYPYYTSFSDTLLAHHRRNAATLIQERGLNGRSFVVELASNDGALLRNFVECGIPSLGIDPADGPARAARDAGVPTLRAFFGRSLALTLRTEGKAADLVLANNVLAHVADTNGFVSGIRILLKDEGLAVLEVPYLRDLVDACEFDTIYHEHLCYFSASSLVPLFRRHGLHLNHVERIPIHGGSLRLHVSPRRDERPSVAALLEEESRLGLDRFEYFAQFGIRVSALRLALRALLLDLRGLGRRIAGYGAAAKGATLLNFAGIGPDLVEFVVDRNLHKQGKYMPGTHQPICHPSTLLTERPDYTLLLAWNFRDEILRQQEPYRSAGGRFVVPLPEPRVV